MLALSLFLAQSAPPPVSIDWQSNAISVAIIAYLGLSIWEKFKRKPALEETFATKKATEEGDERLAIALNKLDERTRVEISALDTRTQQSIRAMNDVGEKRAQANRDLIQEKVASLEKSIATQIRDNRENNSEKFAALFTKLDSHQITMQGLSNDVMHQIGRLEGRVETLTKERAAA